MDCECVMSDWSVCRMEDLIDEISMGPFGSDIKVACFVDEGIPVLNGSNLSGIRLSEESFRFVTEEKADSLKKASAVRGDVVVTHRGTLGQIAYIPQTSRYPRYVISQSQFRFRCNDQVLPEYVVYFFHTQVGQDKILAYASQVGVPAIARASSSFREIEIPVPPLSIQRRIVSVLSALDDKIENNRKICETLEEMAQAIFKEWFVDFGPWGGVMPKGWRKGVLSELIEVCYGKDHKKLPDGPIPVYGSGGFMRGVDRSLYDKASVLIPRKGTLNNIMYSDEPFWTVDTMFYSKMRKARVARYVHQFLKTKNMDELNVGSAVPSMTTDILTHMPVLIPADSDLRRFDDVMAAMYTTQKQKAKETKVLAEMRDTLLPKLMSGEIDVDKVEI